MINIKSINVKTDKWIFNNPSTLGNRVIFDFEYLPNEWFKKSFKEITIKSITLGKPTFETLHRYNAALKRFFVFLNEYKINLKKLEDMTHQMTEMYVFYLQQQHIANSTSAIAMSALKWVVGFGTYFDYEGFPDHELFDGDEYQALKTEDILKTRYIPDTVMKQIECALRKEVNINIRCLIEIFIDTGLRLSEGLVLSKDCITEDFTGKPIMFVYSKKNETERFIPVSGRVKRAIDTLVKNSEFGRNELKTNSILLYWQKIKCQHGKLIQKIAREMLAKFVKDHQILDVDGTSLYPLSFHAFRHTLGTDMLNKGMSIFEIRDYLGHLSLHSTSGYAKVKNPLVFKQYKKAGFVGMIVERINEDTIGTGLKLDDETLKSAALPDGSCKKPINNEGNLCAKFNMCIICPKFITTPNHLYIHKGHLERLREDRHSYMAKEYIGTTNHLETIEYALETIIERLEAMINGNEPNKTTI